MQPAKTALSVVVITLNAAGQLRPCLESAAFADELLVIDSGSSDGTAALAESLGARVIQQDWLGFGRQKQFAIEQARNDWVLCLDADERLTPALRASIAQAMVTPQHKAYRFARRNRFLGRYLRHGEGYPDWSLRLFDRRHGRWSDDPVHEKVISSDAPATLAGDLLHDSAESLSVYLGKQNRYTSLAAEAACRAGKRASPLQMGLSPLVRFVKFYFLRRGFLDGVPGLIHIAIGCVNSFIKYAKMIEIRGHSATNASPAPFRKDNSK